MTATTNLNWLTMTPAARQHLQALVEAAGLDPRNVHCEVSVTGDDELTLHVTEHLLNADGQKYLDETNEPASRPVDIPIASSDLAKLGAPQ